MNHACMSPCAIAHAGKAAQLGEAMVRDYSKPAWGNKWQVDVKYMESASVYTSHVCHEVQFHGCQSMVE